jgi:hypothetical protein
VELQFDADWTDVTDYAYGREGGGVSITRGRSDEGTRADPARCTLELNNRDGRFSPRNPGSPHYGQLGRNTPIRVSLDPGTAVALYLPGAPTGEVAGYVTTPDVAALDIVGDIDIRLEATLDNWMNTAPVELAGKYGAAGQRSWWLGMADEHLRFEWSADGTNLTQVESTEVLVLRPSRRQAVRVTLDVNNGASGNTTTFYTADSIDGPWTQLGDAVDNSGTTSIFSSTAALEVGDVSALGYKGGTGRIHAFELRNGIAGTAVANPVFSDVTSGATSFADSAGRTWTVAGNGELTGRRVRFIGEVSSWPTRWSTGGHDVYVPIEASGVLRRLGQGTAPLQSPLRRTLEDADNILAYWPLEDEASATRAASPIDGVGPMVASEVTFAADSTLAGSGPVPTLATGGYLKGAVPAGSGAGWRVELAYQLPALPVGITSMWQVHVSGSAVARALVRASTTAIRIELRDSDENVLDDFETSSTDAINAFIGRWNRLVITGETTGSGHEVTVTWANVLDSANSFFVQTTATGAVCGNVRAVTTGTLAATYDGMAIGHVACFDALSAGGVYAAAVDGYDGETANNRFSRLVNEQGISASRYDGDLTVDSELMGPQGSDSFLDLLREVADADLGILYERATLAAISYRDRATLYNQTPAITISYDDGVLVGELAPTDDDQATRNDVEVQRSGGSSGRVTITEGRLSTLDPPDGVGVYPDSRTLNLHDDSQPERTAGWLAHLGTWDEARYPQVTVHLAKDPSLVEAVTALTEGDVLRLTDLPDFLPPGPVDLMVQGWREEWQQFEWVYTFNCTPASPWTIATIGEDDPDDDAGPTRIDTDGSELDADVDADDTSLIVLATTGPAWCTTAGPAVTADADDLPFDITVGGEVMTATAIEPLLWDTFTRSVSNGWGSTPSTLALAWQTSGGAASDRSVNGSAGLVTLPDTTSIRFQYLVATVTDGEVLTAVTVPALATGGSLRAGIAMRISGASYYQLRANFTTSGAVSLDIVNSGSITDSISSVGQSYTAGSKWWLRMKVVDQTVYGKTWLDGTPEPGWRISDTITSSTIASGLVGVTAARATGNTNVSPAFQFDSWQIVTPQYFTVTRGVNGVATSHADEDDARLATPMIIAL